jgi:hypothetical protein
VSGGPLAQLTIAGTGAHAAATAAVLADAERFEMLYVWIAGVLFFGGLLAMLASFGRAVQRSAFEAIGMGGLYLLADSAPTPVARTFRAALGVQVVVGIAGAIARPYSSLAFGSLVPVWGLGLAGCWGAWCGTFGPRQNAPRP